jgi:EmrB/QacA subfamily drug resistance transporter
MTATSRILPLTIAAALFMEQMDSTIIATSLPDIARDLGTSPVSLKLAFTTYLLGLTVFLPICGWAADRFGAKLVFRLAIVVFTIGSVACGFAQSLEWLIASRAVQGIGGALMVPVGRIVLLRSVEKKDLLDAVAWLTIPALIGPAIGPVVGGYITTFYDWRWIFWINLPFGLAALALATWLMPDMPAEHKVALDVKGFLLSSGGLSLSVFGMTIVGRDIFSGVVVAAMIVAGLALLWLYMIHARRVASPILDFRLMRFNSFRHSVIGGNLYRLIVGASPFLLPLMLQLGFGMTAFQSGMVTFASTLGALAMKFTVAPIVRLFGYRNLLICNGLASCALFAAMALFTVSTPYFVMFGLLLLGGFLRSLQFSSLNTLAYADTSKAEMAQAIAVYTVLQQLFLVFGVALAGFILDARLWWFQREELVAQDFSFAIALLAVCSAFAVLSFLKLEPNAGASISGKG